MTFAVLADQHCHNWSAFSAIDKNGVNNRLQMILNEIERAADELVAAGGHRMIFAGDLFHVRGSIAPSVFNPVHETITRILKKHPILHIHAIPGNHDLASADTTKIGNAIETMGAIERFHVWTHRYINGDAKMVLIPWFNNLSELYEILENTAFDLGAKAAEFDVFIHAGINGVITGMPDHALDAAKLASLGFKRIFAGHYHNHKVMEGGKVISIGATTHHTWSDVGSQAGFLLCDDKSVKFRASHAPSFVEVNETTDELEIPLIADGNYVRVRGMKLTDSEAKKLRSELLDMGALGVSIEVARVVATARATPVKSMKLEESIEAYVKEKEYGALEADILSRALEVLTEARAVEA